MSGLKNKSGRHAPAFILIFLMQGPAYGSLIFKKMEEQIPFKLFDSPTLYRTLDKLEKKGIVNSWWDTSEKGPAKKWYQITDKGIEMLGEYREDIIMRIKDMEFFLEEYEKYLGKKETEQDDFF
ncbi:MULTISPECIES: PadR family transcriptional regulator [unclassified Methanosarcina]|uniref:PadR family transcriptional regulator n=1 Tax=unclassified Methanosarcina TaxID=2644672 RepID=UPI00064E804D|nr:MULTISPECIES: PadR family transcriptional regulator [unclassified Methanosarcina]